MNGFFLQLLRTVSNPELNKIDEVSEESTVQSSKLNRSLTDIVQSTEEPTVSTTTKKPSNASSSSSHSGSTGSASDDEDEDEMHTLSIALQNLVDEDENAQKIKHCASEPVFKAEKSKALNVESHLDEYDDDDDVWCNQEDEDNLEHRVKLDEEKEKHLREILGAETFKIVQEALKVMNSLQIDLFLEFPFFFSKER